MSTRNTRPSLGPNSKSAMPDRPYLFYELTNSLCATCLRKVEAKVVDHGTL